MEDREILRCRREIDRIDRRMLILLNQRAELAKKIGEIKRVNGAPALDLERERRILEALARENTGPLPDGSVKQVFLEIISACRELQEPLLVAYLGPEATFSHMAALERFGGSCACEPQPSIMDVFQQVESGQARFGVVPLENSSEGSVSLTLDGLIQTDIKICGEIIMPIAHALLSREEKLEAIDRVISHPQALSQCRGWMARNLPHIPQLEASSTAAAAQKALSRPGTAVIGSELMAKKYGLNRLARGIQDNPMNFTRFIILGKEEAARTGRDKTSILFVTKHIPGSLHRALGAFADKGINLTRIESRPLKIRPWEYVFFVDLQGHILDPKLQEALKSQQSRVEYLKLLGSYPMAAPHPHGEGVLSRQASGSASD